MNTLIVIPLDYLSHIRHKSLHKVDHDNTDEWKRDLYLPPALLQKPESHRPRINQNRLASLATVRTARATVYATNKIANSKALTPTITSGCRGILTLAERIPFIKMANSSTQADKSCKNTGEQGPHFPGQLMPELLSCLRPFWFVLALKPLPQMKRPWTHPLHGIRQA